MLRSKMDAFVLLAAVLIISVIVAGTNMVMFEKIVERDVERSVATGSTEMVCECSLQEIRKTEYPLYTVNGAMLPECFQHHLYNSLKLYGIEYMYEVLICEIYQESRFDTEAANANGLDFGLCQFRKTYWEYHSNLSGYAGAYLMDPYAQIGTMAYLTAEHLKQTGWNTAEAVKLYFNSGDPAMDAQYWADVSQWFGTLQRIN